MRTTAKLRFTGMALLCAGVLAVGCSSDSKAPEVVRGTAGESCQVHADCADGLTCVHQVCISGSGNTQNDAGAAQQTSLGARGESCTSRSDCAPGLACLSNVCADPDEPKPDAGVLVVRGQRGETCRTRADCVEGLACVGGSCQLADFDIAATTKTCKLVECKEAADCCPKPSSSCPFYKDFCDQGDQTSCAQYQTSCVCDETLYSCNDNKCSYTPKCDATHACISPLVCAGTKCVQCAEDADCVSGKCVDQKCMTKCEKDADCPYFNKCTDGACVKSGCTTDRECIASTKNVRSKCEKGASGIGECLVPCETDLECSSATQFTFKACLSGYCKDVGCETDEECRILLQALPGGTQNAVCQ